MSAFLIDARFLLRNTTETFWGAPLIVVDGKDNTFCYGFMRDLLRLRSSLHISAGAMVFGSDACSLASEKEIRSVVDLCRELGVVVIWEPKVPVLAIVATHADRFSNIVTDDRRMLCFCTESIPFQLCPLANCPQVQVKVLSDRLIGQMLSAMKLPNLAIYVEVDHENTFSSLSTQLETPGQPGCIRL